jgi:signal transduction histidine kinase
MVYFFADSSTNADFSLVMIRLSLLFSSLLPLFFLYFSYIFPRYRPVSLGKRIGFSILPIFLAVTSFSTLMVTSVTHQWWGTEITATGGLFVLQSVYFLGYLILALASLFLRRNRYQGATRNQINFVIFGGVVAVLANFITNFVLVLFGISQYGVIIGVPSFLVMIGCIAYAIIRHRLFDFRLVVARSLAYILLLAALATLYGVGLFAASRLFFTNTQVGVSEQVTYLVLALVLAFTFQPLRRFFESITDRIFFRNRYDSQQVLADFSNILVREIDLDDLLKNGLHGISKGLSIAYGQLIVLDEGKIYRVAHHGDLPKRLIVEPKLRALNKSIIVADELEGGAVKDILDEHGLRVSAILRSHNEIIGYLLLGDKLSGDIYSKQDVEVIGIMAKELAVAVSNAKAYEEIQDFAATLQERVNHATSRLRVVNRHLKELDQAKDEFLSLASHQLRTPLTTIKGYLSMVLEGDAGKLNKMQTEFTQYAFEGSERMVRLISDLLDVSRMSAGRFVIQPTPTDINALMTSEVQQLQSHAESKQLKLSLVMPEAPIPMVMLDENKTRQVVMNFIDNAIYYTEKGSVTVVLSVKAGNIHLEVRDTGMGVPPEAQKHLFSKFYRATNAQKSRPDGTGLGLFLAKRVVEDQGGSLIFSSTEGKGSVFGFDIPIVAAKATKDKA